MKKDENTRLMKWLAVALVLIGAFLFVMFSSQAEEETPTGAAEDVDLTITEDDNVKGSSDAEFQLVEYSDFQCPACKTRVAVVEALIAEFGNHIQFAYRHFPLRSIHGNAQMAGQATEAAAMQDSFWEMHDMLFEKQSEWSVLAPSKAQDTFVAYAEELGLDAEQFENDMTSSAVEDAVNADFESGMAAGVSATPSFFFNGEYVNIKTGDYEQFREYIREKIQSAS